VVRGYRGGTDETAAIYNTRNGLATTYAGGTGFYFNDNGFFKVGTNTSNAKFDPTANSNAGLFTVTGEIQATSGYIGGTTSGWKIDSSLLSNGIFGLSAPVQTLGQGTISPITHAVTAVSNKVFTSTGHTFLVGDIVRTKNMGPGGSPAGGYNGVFTINAVTTNTFTVTTSTTGTSTPVNGSATGENVITLTSPTITPLKSMSITGNTISRGTYIASISGSGPYRLTLSEVIDRDYIIGSQTEVSGTAIISNYSIYSGNATKELSKFKVDYEGNVFAKTGTLGSLKLSEAGLYAKSNIVGTGYYQMGMVVNPVGFESSGFWVRKFNQSNIFAGQVSLEPSGVFWTSQNSTSAAGIYVEPNGDFRIFAGKGVGNATGSSLLVTSGNMSRPWMYAQASEYIAPGVSNPILVDFIDGTLELTYSDPGVGGNGVRYVSTAGNMYAAGTIQADGGFIGNISGSAGSAGSATTAADATRAAFLSGGGVARIQATSWTAGDGNGTAYNGDLIYPVNYDTLVIHASTRIASKTIRDNTTASGANVNISTGTLMSLQRVSSSYHIKHDIKPLSEYSNLSHIVPEEKISGLGGIDLLKILDVVPVSFRSLGSDDDPDLVRVGFIAQDIAEKVPEVATYDEHGEVTYFDINAVASALLAVCQNQETRIKELENRLAALES
jgi:hypothetical protein